MQPLLFSSCRRIDAQVEATTIFRHPRNRVVPAGLPRIEMLTAILRAEIAKHIAQRNLALPLAAIVARTIPGVAALKRIVERLIAMTLRCESVGSKQD